VSDGQPRFEIVDAPPPKAKRPGRPNAVYDILRIAATRPRVWIKVTGVIFPSRTAIAGTVQRLKKGPAPRGEWADWDILIRTGDSDVPHIYARFNGRPE
jgi:hypothetical protein